MLAEVPRKIALVQKALAAHGLDAVVLRGVDYFTWLSAGLEPRVLLSSETGVAELLVTPSRACVLTNEIERERVEAEWGSDFEIVSQPWIDAIASPRKQLAALLGSGGGRVASDRPSGEESALPAAIIEAKRTLGIEEQQRYRILGRLTARAMRETLEAARPEWSELKLAAELSLRLVERGIEPALILAAGEERLPRFRHPLPTDARLGRRLMLVTCARKGGLFANLTRMRSFDALSSTEEKALLAVKRIQTRMHAATRPGVSYAEFWKELAAAYAAEGAAEALTEHHQGGPTGYLSREFIVTPRTSGEIEANRAYAWNPSVRGAKCEDTILLTDAGVEVLTRED